MVLNVFKLQEDDDDHDLGGRGVPDWGGHDQNIPQSLGEHTKQYHMTHLQNTHNLVLTLMW